MYSAIIAIYVFYSASRAESSPSFVAFLFLFAYYSYSHM